MSTPKDKQLYKKVKDEIYKRYPEHSPYRSSLLVKEYIPGLSISPIKETKIGLGTLTIKCNSGLSSSFLYLFSIKLDA